MGKRLTPEEREARIKEYEELRAAKQAAKEEKRKARLEAYEKAKADRAKKREREKRGIAAAESKEGGKIGYIRNLPAFKGKVEAGDEVGFRWIGLPLKGIVQEFISEKHYKDEALGEDVEPVRERVEYFIIKDFGGDVYPIKKSDILCKKINGLWKAKA